MVTKLKLKVLEYWLGDKCYCGNSKKGKRWVCLTCKEVGDSLEQAKVLDMACKNHIKQAIRYMNKTKRKINGNLDTTPSA